MGFLDDMRARVRKANMAARAWKNNTSVPFGKSVRDLFTPSHWRVNYGNRGTRQRNTSPKFVGPRPPTEEEKVWAPRHQKAQAQKQAQHNTNISPKQLKGELSTLASVQEMLINQMRSVISHSTIGRTPVRDLRSPGLVGTDADLISYYGNPDVLSSALLMPPESRAFVHGTPAQLSLLEPLLRFYVVDQDGAQREVYFSDYTTEERLLKLSSLRRANGVDEVFSPKSEVGANVGVRDFSWEYHNKHEGDKIVQASLNIYFGSLSELVNLNYLQFLFTNGLKNPAAPPVANIAGGKEIPNTTIQQRILAYKKEIQDKMQFMQPTQVNPKSKTYTPAPDEAMDKRIKEDFRQLKVAVGWSLPKGRKTEMLRLFRGNTHKEKSKALKSFLQGVSGTQQILLLNLRNYDVKFEQNGSCVLSIQYVASTDNYLSRPASDVLGSRNFKSGHLNKRVVEVPLDTVELDKCWGQGYLAYQATQSIKNGSNSIRLRLDKLTSESDILAATIKIKELENEASSRTTEDKDLKFFREASEQVESAYFAVKNAIKQERYSQFLARIMSGHLFQAEVRNGAKGGFELKYSGQAVNGANAKVREWFKKIAKANVTKGGATQESADKIAKSLFERFPASKVNPNHNFMQLYYVRLGDLIKIAMEQSGMREDISWLLGSFYPGTAGVPGYAAGTAAEIPEMIYDIPISLEYFGQFFYKNVVLEERDEWPFRTFMEGLLSMVTQAMNRATKYRLGINFDYTVFSTYTNMMTNTGIMTESDIHRFRPALAGESYHQNKKVKSYYILYVKQMSHRGRTGKRSADENVGIYHYTIGSSRGLAKEFHFKAQDVPQFQAMNLEINNRAHEGTSLSRALILPQNVDIDMMGNSLHKNGDLIYVDSRQALGSFANSVLTLGGYYRVVRSTHTISSAGYHTTLGCVFERRTNG